MEQPLLERDSFLDALRGASGLVFVAGEAGVGKTALVRAFSAEARARVRVLEGACDPRCSPSCARGRLCSWMSVSRPGGAWDAKHSSRPSLFGQEFNFTPAPNRYGLPAFYSLHAWIWKHNHHGPFSMWNPSVNCDNA